MGEVHGGDVRTAAAPGRVRGRLAVAEPTTSAAHLSRARWRMAALYTLTSALGLFVLGAVAIHTDGQFRSDRIDSEIRRRGTMSQSLMHHFDEEPHGIDLGRIDDDAISRKCVSTAECSAPSDIYAFGFYEHDDANDPTEEEKKFIFRGNLGAPMPDIDVADLVEDAYIHESDIGEFRDIVARDGRMLRVVGVAYYDKYKQDGARAGTIIVAADPDLVDTSSHSLALAVWGGCAGLIALSALGGWWLAGRSLRPAVRALDQQERFLANAAHELRMPIARVFAVSESAQLTALLLTSELEHHDLDEKTREYLVELQRDLARVTTLTDQTGHTVNNLLTLARMDADRIDLELSPLRLDQLALVVADAYPEAQVGTVDKAVVNGDAVLLRRAVENLVENAINHGRPAHVLNLHDNTTVDEQPEAQPTLSVRVNGSRVSVTVTDTGPGVDPDLADTLFTRFRSGAESRGSGLGLSIVQWIASAHGGTIAVANRPADHGPGAVFTLDLPRVPTPTDAGRPAGGVAEAGAEPAPVLTDTV